MNTVKELKKTKAISTIQQTVGWIIAVFSVFILAVGLSEIHEPLDVGMCIFFFIFLAVGIFLILKGIARKKLIAKYRLYTSLLSQDPYKSLDRLSTITNESVDTITVNIKKMLSCGLLHNIGINYDKNCLIDLDPNKVQPIDGSYNSKVAPKFVVVKCPGCGALNRIIEGTTTKCEYCGAFIQAPTNK